MVKAIQTPASRRGSARRRQHRRRGGERRRLRCGDAQKRTPSRRPGDRAATTESRRSRPPPSCPREARWRLARVRRQRADSPRRTGESAQAWRDRIAEARRREFGRRRGVRHRAGRCRRSLSRWRATPVSRQMMKSLGVSRMAAPGGPHRPPLAVAQPGCLEADTGRRRRIARRVARSMVRAAREGRPGRRSLVVPQLTAGARQRQCGRPANGELHLAAAPDRSNRGRSTGKPGQR